MFSDLIDQERRDFDRQNYENYIPGYTGHCPTLKFHYGKCYGAKTREILKDIRNSRIFKDVSKTPYRHQDHKQDILRPIERQKGQFENYTEKFQKQAPKCILGYTGFVPTMNFRYGKSYSRAADDSFKEYSNAKRRVAISEAEVDRMFRYKSAPAGLMRPIKTDEEVKMAMEHYIDRQGFKDRKISPEVPPIAGYTGHIPGVKGNEESLSYRYNTVVKRGLSILQKQRQKYEEMKKAQNRVQSVMTEYEELHS